MSSPKCESIQYIHSKVHSYLWLFSFPGMRSPDGSMGEGSRLRQEAKDWLESSLDTVHITKQIPVKSQRAY